MHLLACISHHGYGHLAQSAPVLNRLAELRPDLRLTIRSALPRDKLAGRIHVPFEHLPTAADCGLVMRDALRIDLPTSLAAWRAFHRDWDERVATEARGLAALGIDAVFSNVAYLPLAAARRQALPALALCSLNWADIFAHQFAREAARDADTRVWLGQMRAAYRAADAFLCPAPSMPMDDLPNRISLPPICALGRARCDELRRRLGVGPSMRLVTLGMGGVGYRPPLEGWPEQDGIVWLVPDEWSATRRDVRAFSRAGMNYLDMLASSDALITKPGYGSFVEAAVHGLPVLYLPRSDWPESPALEIWLIRHTRAARLAEEDLRRGALAGALEALWGLPAPPRPKPEGAEMAARRLAALPTA